MVGFNILPIGFSSYEKSTIETFFRLAGRRAPYWGLTTRSAEARVILLNATSQQDVDSFRSLVASWQKVILVGASDFGTGWQVLPRPIKLTAILSLLDAIAKEAGAIANDSGGTAAPTTKIDNISKDDSTAKTLESTGVSAQAFNAMIADKIKQQATDSFANINVQTQIKPVFASKTAPAVEMTEAPSYTSAVSRDDAITSHTIREPGDTLGRALIVDDSDIALKYMKNRLQHMGYESDLVRSGEEALAIVAKQSYQFVFLDVMMEGLDGYKTCRAIKSNKARRGPPPIVVMLTSKGGTIDKIRGNMAGCDAYLTKPLNEKRLASVLAQFDSSTMTQRWQNLNSQTGMLKEMLAAKQ